jgi:hypothetical protein
MNSTRVLSITLLLLVGAAALFGGGSMLIDPTGVSLGLSPELLQATSFGTFLFPGLVLFLSVGIFGVTTAVLTLMKHPLASRLTILQGTILAGWIAVQAYLLQVFDPLQVVVGGIGFTLFCLGLFEADEETAGNENDLMVDKEKETNLFR